eukprot:CAMPEP_0179411300 /NCGR_PEP_ID=MMETSP0799-20121207/3821_1 /TAXON_ID=46947 /ORGANISM="Geminigera cryophila, Strain CCMP2564" /LENGTH=291 /DNA_ID=CAMNT_0021183355 /DNA_START=85 /DNA_END=959 /DNA_ORIENTATION=+
MAMAQFTWAILLVAAVVQRAMPAEGMIDIEQNVQRVQGTQLCRGRGEGSGRAKCFQPLAFMNVLGKSMLVQRTSSHCPQKWKRSVASSATAINSRGLNMAAAASTTELILDEIKTTDGVDVAMKLESLGGSKRRISGGILIEAPVRAVWDVLTDYNRLQEYIPNIADSRTIRQPNGRLYLEQVGVVSKRIGLTSRILLDVEEFPYSKLTFTRVESREFLEFMGDIYIDAEGRWEHIFILLLGGTPATSAAYFHSSKQDSIFGSPDAAISAFKGLGMGSQRFVATPKSPRLF